MDTFRISYEVHKPRGFYLPYKKRSCKHKLCISSDLLPGRLTYLWLGSCFPEVSSIHPSSPHCEKTPPDYISRVSVPIVHSFSHWFIFSSAGFLVPELWVRDLVTNQRQPLPSQSLQVSTKQSWEMLGEWMSRFFLDIPWLLCYFTRAAMTKVHRLVA